MSETELQPDVSNMHLQIWRQDGNSDSYVYKLRWEYRISGLELNSNHGNAWRVSILFLILLSPKRMNTRAWIFVLNILGYQQPNISECNIK